MAVMRIRELRKQAGFTQATLAEAMGVTQTIASDWENEVYLPRTRQLPALAKLFGVTINDLFTPEVLPPYSRQDTEVKPEYLQWGMTKLDNALYAELGDFVVIGGYADGVDSGAGKNEKRVLSTVKGLSSDMPLLDTRQNRDLTGTLIADIVLQLLSYVAQTEREFIRQRQAEGIAAAKARGVKFGRPQKERPKGFNEVKARWERGELSARAAGAELQITHRTFLLWARDAQC